MVAVLIQEHHQTEAEKKAKAEADAKAKKDKEEAEAKDNNKKTSGDKKSDEAKENSKGNPNYQWDMGADYNLSADPTYSDLYASIIFTKGNDNTVNRVSLGTMRLPNMVALQSMTVATVNRKTNSMVT